MYITTHFFLLKNLRLFPCLVLLALEWLFCKRSFPLSKKKKIMLKKEGSIRLCPHPFQRMVTPVTVVECHLRAAYPGLRMPLFRLSTNFLLNRGLFCHYCTRIQRNKYE